jgi:tetratricopeptide (TPR) repeat protein
MRACYGEGSRWLDAALARAGESAPSHERAWALGFGCLLAVGLDDFPRGRRLGEAALALARTLDDPRLIAYVARPLSLHQSCQGELEQAKMLQTEGLNAAHAIGDRWAMTALLSEISPDIPEVAQAVLSDEKQFLALTREVGDRLLIPHTLYRLANTAARQGDRKRATKFLEEALMIARQVNGKRGMIFFLQGLGQIHCAQGSHLQAESYYLEALEIAYQIGTPGMIALIILRLGELAQAQGQSHQALQRYQQCLKMVKDMDHQLLVAKCLSVIATLSGSPDSPLEAAVAMQLEGAADALAGGRTFSADLIDLAELNDRRSAIRNQLADPMLATAWAEGNVMSLNAAIAYALILGSHDAPQSEYHSLPQIDL